MNQGVPYNKAPLSFMLNNKLFYQEVVYTKIIQIFLASNKQLPVYCTISGREVVLYGRGAVRYA